MLNEDLIRINNAVLRIRKKTDTSTAPIEDVAKAVEEFKGETNIYRVATVEERDALQANEGDLCVVYTNEIGNYAVGASITSLCFPDEIVIETAIASSYSARFRNSGTYEGLMISLSASQFMVRDYMTYQTIVGYTSSDGVTYTKEAAYANVTEYTASAPLPPEMGATETIYQFLFTQTLAFGCYSYLENAWNYTDIGCSISEDLIFKPGKAYSNTGIKEGILDEKQYRNNFLYFQQTEPGNKKGVWCKLKTTQLFNHSEYTKNCNTEMTDLDLGGSNNTFSFVRNSLFRVIPNASAVDWDYTTCNGGDVLQSLSILYNGSSTYRYYGVLLNGKYYAYDSTNRMIYLFDFINNTRTSKASAPSTMSSYTVEDVAYKNNKIYFLTRTSSGNTSGYTGGMFIYDISANTWSNYSLGNPGSAYSKPLSLIITDNNIYYTYKSNSNGDLFYIRKLNISSMSLISTISIDRATDIQDITKRNDFTHSFRIAALTSYNSTGNTIYNPYFSLDLTTFTKEAILEQINSEDYHPGWMDHPYIEGEEYTYWYPYQRYYIGKDNIETREQHVIPYSVSDGDTLQCTLNFMFRYNNKIYAFKQTGTKLYSLDLDAATVMPSYNPTIQIGDGGKEVEISEGLTVKLKNVWTYNYNGTSMNGVEQIYIGDGTEWKLFKDYTL